MEKKIKQINRTRSIMSWSWILIVAFFALSFWDERFGLLGFVCMLVPIGLALSGRGKVHCSHYCPRGSFFGKFLSLVSLKRTMPRFMTTKWFRHAFLVFMLTRFGFCLYRLGFENIAFGMFRFMLSSFILGIVLGIVFLPRSWCKVCPMGHTAGMIRDLYTARETAGSEKSA